MFHLIEFDMECKDVTHLIYTLLYPNSTIISYSRSIHVPSLPRHRRIVWIDLAQIESHPSLYKNFHKLYGIKRFDVLDMGISIYDPHWLWNDLFMDKVFEKFL